MPTTFVKGDLFADGQALAFAADCSGAMDKGVAVAFAKRWPELAEAFRAHAASGKMQPGDVWTWKPSAVQGLNGPPAVYALGIQSGDKKPKVSVLTRALEAMLARAPADGVSRIALPRIGAGKGGIDRLRVKRVLEEAGNRTGITLVVYEQFVRTERSPAPQAT